MKHVQIHGRTPQIRQGLRHGSQCDLYDAIKGTDSYILAIWNKMFGRQCSKACGSQLSGGATLESAKKSSCLRRAKSKTTPPRYSKYLSRAQDSATGVRIGKYARSAYRRVILRGGNDSRAHHETHYVQEI